MRVLLVLLGLVAMPLLAGVAQERDVSGHRVHAKKQHAVGHSDERKATRQLADRDGENDDNQQCDKDDDDCAAPAQPPPPPPPPSGGCVASPPAGGTASIDGQVFVDASPWPGLANWCVQAGGPVTATAVTDASGNYLFSGLPGGTYTVCETVQAGYHQTFPTSGPTCATGWGWTITVMDGGSASFIWFGNLTP